MVILSLKRSHLLHPQKAIPTERFAIALPHPKTAIASPNPQTAIPTERFAIASPNTPNKRSHLLHIPKRDRTPHFQTSDLTPTHPKKRFLGRFSLSHPTSQTAIPRSLFAIALPHPQQAIPRSRFAIASPHPKKRTACSSTSLSHSQHP
ncbi:MAG: hypothetical protein HEQ26_19575 [Dolichospermum sp. DL01]|nr:MAG: hypothetical protein HEQ26_19575 [Dolichospermum sp. DL01]